MKLLHPKRLLAPALILLAVGQPVSVYAQTPPAPVVAPEAPPSVPVPATPPPAGTPASTKPAADVKISFNFKNAPFDQVLDFFSRQTGLPVIRETEPPPVAVTFISPEKYTRDAAFDILNRLLYPHGVQMREQAGFWLLSKMDEMKALGPVLSEKVPDALGDTTVVTVVVPLNNAQATLIAESIKPLVSKYGSVTTLGPQNALVLVDTASQCRRLGEIIRQLDSEPPTDARFQLFELKHADAATVLPSLKGLMTEKRVLQVMDKDGNVRTREENRMDGLTLQADARTNSIIAVGVESRLQAVEQLIQLLDRPGEGVSGAGGTTRQLMSFDLPRVGVAEAASQVTALFASAPAEQRPSVLPVASRNRLVLVGSTDELAQAQRLLEQIDPGVTRVDTGAASAPTDSSIASAETVPLKHADARAVTNLLNRLLSPRQLGLLRFSQGLDNQSLIVAGPAEEIANLRRLVDSFDRAPVGDAQVRQIRIARGDVKAILARATELFNIPERNRELNVKATADDRERLITIIGPESGIESFVQSLRSVETNLVIDRELRTFTLEKAVPSATIARLTAMSAAMLSPADGTPFEAPEIRPLDETRTLVVRALPSQLPTIEQLVRKLDRVDADAMVVRVLSLRAGNPIDLATRAAELFKTKAASSPLSLPQVTPDSDTRTLLLVGESTSVAAYVQIVEEIQKQAQPAREVRTVALRSAKPAEVIDVLRRVHTQWSALSGSPVPAPVFEPLEETNGLLIAADAAQIGVILEFIQELDQQSAGRDSELRRFPLTRLDPTAAAGFVRDLAAATNQQTVRVSTDPGQRAIVVAAPAKTLIDIEKMLAQLDAPIDRPKLTLRLFALKSARADAVAPLLRSLLDSRLRETLSPEALASPDAARLVEVLAEPGSNTVIVSAPPELQPQAEELLARFDAPPASADSTSVRVIPLAAGDAAATAEALKQTLGATKLPSGGQLTVSASPAANAVIIAGRSEDLDQVEAVIKSLDVPVKGQEAVDVVTVNLKHARADLVAPVLETLLVKEDEQLPFWARGPRQSNEPAPVRVAAETRTNSVVVTGPTRIVEVAKRILAQLDVTPGPDGAYQRPIRVISLQNAAATEVAVTVREMFKAEPDPTLAPVVQIDAQSNSLIVRAGTAQLAEIENLVSALDQATVSARRELRTIPIDRSRADAEVIAQSLQRLLEQRSGTRVRIIKADDLLKPDHTPAAPAPDAAPKEEEGSTPTKPGAFLVPSRYLPHVLITTLVLAPVEQQGPPAPVKTPQPAPGETDTITIAVDPVTNSLIISGSTWATERATALAAELQRQLPAEPLQVTVVQLPDSAEAWTVAQLVNGAIGQIGTISPSNPGGLTGRCSVQPDPTGSALIVSANPTDLKTLGQIIAAVAAPNPGADLTVKSYPLSNTNAPRLLRAVNDLFSSAPRGRQAQRVLRLNVPGGGAASAKIDPASIRAAIGPGGSSLIIAAPADAIPLLDQFIALMDQSPAADHASIKQYPLARARAEEVAGTLQRAFAAAQAAGGEDVPRASFIPEPRTNTLLITATEQQHAQAKALLASIDAPTAPANAAVAILPIASTRPSVIRGVLENLLIGRDAARRDVVQLTASDETGVLIVQAPQADIDQARKLVKELDRADTELAPIQTITLERADPEQVASSLQRFFDERARASSRPGRAITRQAAIIGDDRTGSLIVSAPEDDLEQIRSLAKTFDAPSAAADVQFRVIPLQHARVEDIRGAVEAMARQAQNSGVESMFRPGRRRDGGGPAGGGGDLVVEFDDRSSSVVIIGREDAFAPVERIIRALDTEDAARSEVAIRSFRLQGLNPRTVGQAIRQAVNPAPGTRRNEADLVSFEVDSASQSLLLVGPKSRLDQAEAMIENLQKTAGGEASRIESLTLKFAQADSLARSLERFFVQRAKGDAGARPVSIVGAPEGNVLIVAGAEDDVALVRSFVAKMDQPGDQEGRRRELYKLRNAVAPDLAALVREQFPRTPGSRESAVVVTSDRQTNTLIVSAPAELFESVDALVAQLDAAPDKDNVSITSVTLSTARADEVAVALRTALPPSVKVTITPVRRGNSLLLSGSEEAIKLVMEQVTKLDQQPVRAEAEIRRIRIKNAELYETASTLRTVIESWQIDPNEPEPTVSILSTDNSVLVSARADRLAEIAKIVEQLDVAGDSQRKTEFVVLKFADAQATADALRVFYGRYAPEPPTPGARAVTIIANPASKSLVIAADDSEWPGIRALIDKLDTDQYDTSRRLEIIALRHADAVSLARTLTEAFAAPLRAEIERQRAEQQRIYNQRGNRGGRGGVGDDVFPAPTVLVESDPGVSVTAEPLTNSLVVAGPREQTDRIKAVVAQLDMPEFARMPELRMIPVSVGVASALANTLRPLFTDQSGANGTVKGSRAVMIVGEDRGNVLIVRAEESQFAQIKAMADGLQQEGDRSQLSVRVVRLRYMPAGRVMASLKSTFAPVAQQNNEPLAIELDRTGNGLVIAASKRLFDQIKAVAEELDVKPADGADPAQGAFPVGLNQGIAMVDLQHHTPTRMVELLTQLGVTRPQNPEQPGLVAEPVTLASMTSRRAIAVVGGAGDIAVVSQLVKSLDVAPVDAEQHVAIINLKKARADAIAATIQAMLNPTDQQSRVDLAASLSEQVRRLAIHRAEPDAAKLTVDLSKPIVVRAELQTNSLILASTEANVKAVQDLVGMLDQLPIGEQVVVRIFPLQSASAQRLSGVIRELFAQGDRLRLQPASGARTDPGSEVGRSLVGQVYVSVDERTNSLLAAGQESAVALVEVLIKQLDNERTAQWIEPTLIRLEHADAVRLAETLRQVLLEGNTASPESEALQRQIARLRIVQDGANPADPSKVFQADRFAPLTSLVIIPESTLNALIVVGTRANAAAVAELARMLDVPAAAASNTVRIFPLQVAAAERVASLLSEVFRGQVAAGTLRDEDNLVIVPDSRTNSLVISTSPRSFRMVDDLIAQLDAKSAVPLFGVTVIPVPSGDVRELAPRLERLLQERIAASRRAGEAANPSDKVSIQPDPTTNSLMVAASPENVETIRQLLDILTKGAEALAASQVIDVINVTSARAEELAGAIRDLYVEKEQRLRGQDAVRVTGDARLNALIVRGTAEDIRAIRTLVERLDGAEVATVTEIRRIELRQADAADVVRLLQNVLAGRPIAGAGVVGQRKAQVLRFLRQQTAEQIKEAQGQAPTEAAISGAVQEQVTLTAELRTNSLVVVAPSRLMVLIEALVSDLDTTTAGGRSVRVFRLVNADARAMSDVLRELFNLRQQGSQLVLVPGRIDEDAPPEGGSAPDRPDLFPTLDERQALAITIDARTNSLLVSGTPEYLLRVEEVINQLDSIEAQEREQVVYELRNAKAAEIAQTLRSYFTEQSDKVRQLLGPDRSGSLLRILEREITVQGDSSSNRLLVGVSPEYKEMVSRLVDELDSTPPQVMIQVLLAEVTLDTDKSWGFDARVGPFGGELYEIASSATAAGIATSLGVPNLSVSSTDFDLLIRALEAQGRLEVLSRPQILVNNNEQARIQVGEEVALVESVQRFDNGNTVADVTRQDVGIILSVTPNISADGFVRMDILPEISVVSARTTQVTEDFQAPIITKRQVETNVTVKDGETIVIGGLLQSSEDERKTKVPLLGDIPIAGQLFRSSKYISSKTELLVLLTPRVIRSGADGGTAAIRDLSDSELQRLTKPDLLRPFLDGSRIPDPVEGDVKLLAPPSKPEQSPADSSFGAPSSPEPSPAASPAAPPAPPDPAIPPLADPAAHSTGSGS